ncbi:MAG: hypothetical protein ACFFCM_01870 [Promethearchaeota archaeon]
MFRKRPREREDEKEDKIDSNKNEFRAQVDKTTSISVIDTDLKATFIIKRNLHDYKIYVSPSEAPVQNFIKDFDVQPYEDIIAERAVLDKEIFPLNEKIREILGERINLRIRGIRLCFGREDDYITLDERDLENNKISPSIQGLKEFVLSNQRSVLGFCVRYFKPKKGNMVFLKCGYDEPVNEIKSINVKILASLQQRGFYMQKYNKAYGLQMFIILNVRKRNNMITDRVIKLLKELEVPLEMIFLRRSSSIQNWTAIECELDSMNLKNYLQSEFQALSHYDVHQIAIFCENNKLNFDVAQMMGDMLNKMNTMRAQRGKRENALEREEIVAAGIIAATHFGIKGIEPSKDLNMEYLKKVESELNNYY